MENFTSIGPLNSILLDISNELENLIKTEQYRKFGELSRASKTLYQLGFKNDIIIINVSLEGDYYEKTFKVFGYEKLFDLSIIQIDTEGK